MGEPMGKLMDEPTGEHIGELDEPINKLDERMRELHE